MSRTKSEHPWYKELPDYVKRFTSRSNYISWRTEKQTQKKKERLASRVAPLQNLDEHLS